MYLIASLLSLLVLVQGKPYHGYEQPDYTLAKNQPKDKSFEVRVYSAANWTSVSGSGDIMNSPEMFMELFKYIDKGNEQKIKIPMTVPVTIKFRSQPCVFCNDTYTMSFYLPKAYQASHPTPTNPDVTIEERSEMTVYVRKFSGYATYCAYKHNVQMLYGDLLRNGITDKDVVSTSYFGASYDSPFHFMNRRNEAWILASDKIRFN